MWWDEQQKRDTKTAAVANSSSLALSSSQQKTQISQQIPSINAEKKIGLGFENLGFGFGLGLGIRAAMPKMPSFRVNYNVSTLKYCMDLLSFVLNRKLDHLHLLPWTTTIHEDIGTILMTTE